MAGVGEAGSGGSVEPGEPEGFRRAVEGMRRAAVRPEIEINEMAGPKKLAPYSAAFVAEVVLSEDEAPAAGRLVLLHDPEGQEGWEGLYRVVTFSRAELEPEMAIDPLLPEVGWSWLLEALESQQALFTEPSGTVSRTTSQGFGGLTERPARTEMEIRASWTPAGDDFGAHVRAWTEMLCTCAGLPPVESALDVVQLPQRRSP